MNSRTLIQELYKIFANDEILLRLLHYPAKNQRDNPLDKNKSDILTLPPVERFKIIDNVLVSRDKQLELDLSDNFSRINFYLGNKFPKRVYSSGARQLINNPEVAEQQVIIDINTNMEIDKVDWRLNWIRDRVQYLLHSKNVKQLIKLKPEDGYSINQTAKGFVGYRLIYYTVVTESSGCGQW